MRRRVPFFEISSFLFLVSCLIVCVIVGAMIEKIKQKICTRVMSFLGTYLQDVANTLVVADNSNSNGKKNNHDSESKSLLDTNVAAGPMRDTISDVNRTKAKTPMFTPPLPRPPSQSVSSVTSTPSCKRRKVNRNMNVDPIMRERTLVGLQHLQSHFWQSERSQVTREIHPFEKELMKKIMPGFNNDQNCATITQGKELHRSINQYENAVFQRHGHHLWEYSHAIEAFTSFCRLCKHDLFSFLLSFNKNNKTQTVFTELAAVDWDSFGLDCITQQEQSNEIKEEDQPLPTSDMMYKRLKLDAQAQISQCPKCKSWNVKSKNKLERSADEALSTLCTCHNCGNKFKEHS